MGPIRAALAGAALACLVSQLVSQAVAQPVLRVVAPWEVSSLEPSRAGYVFTRMQVTETLLGADDGGLPVPGLATAWTSSEDGLTWTLVLRDGAVFHDGSPVTAEAAAAALLRARSQPGPLGAAPIASVAALDARTLAIRTSEPFTALPAFLAHAGAQVLAPSSYDAAGQVGQVVGSGPFRIVRLDAPLRFEVARNDAWTGGPAPEVARATYQAVGRSETRALLAEGGQAELVFTLDPASQDRLRRAGRVDVRVVPVPRTQVLKLNAGLPFFDDLRERRAVSLLVDRAGIARAVLRNPDAAASQLFPPGVAEWHVPGLPPLRRDVAEARRLLTECGWTPGADGVLVRDGRRFRVALRTFSDRPELPVVAAALQEQLREGGIELQVVVANSSEIPAGHRDGSLEMALFARNFSLVPDPIGTLLQDYGPQGGDFGAMGWKGTELSATLSKLGATAEPRERARLRGQAVAILQAELPVVPIVWYDHSVAVSRRLAGVDVDPMELSYRLSAVRWAK